jgi:hypothetical protein
MASCWAISMIVNPGAGLHRGTCPNPSGSGARSDEAIRAERQLIHKGLSKAIIGAAMTVLNALRPGLDEKLYWKRVVC